jgi:thiamine kinase-like enzyme
LHALPELAAFGLCHQDITVHNILLLSERKMVLIDFGLGRPFEQVFAASNRVLLGWEYMYYPPEYDFFSYLEGMSEKDVIHNRTETLFMIGLTNLMKQVLVFDTFIKE